MSRIIDFTNLNSIKEAQLQAMETMVAHKYKDREIAEYTVLSEDDITSYKRRIRNRRSRMRHKLLL